MRYLLLIISLYISSTLSSSAQDWLIDGSSYKSKVQTTHEGKRLELTNGLLRRTFLLAPNAATIALDNLMTGQNELRAVRPEALLVINGKEYPVGGLTGQPVNNFLTDEFINNMQACDSALPWSTTRSAKARNASPGNRIAGGYPTCTPGLPPANGSPSTTRLRQQPPGNAKT